jgi:hypothetical protein
MQYELSPVSWGSCKLAVDWPLLFGLHEFILTDTVNVTSAHWHHCQTSNQQDDPTALLVQLVLPVGMCPRRWVVVASWHCVASPWRLPYVCCPNGTVGSVGGSSVRRGSLSALRTGCFLLPAARRLKRWKRLNLGLQVTCVKILNWRFLCTLYSICAFLFLVFF